MPADGSFIDLCHLIAQVTGVELPDDYSNLVSRIEARLRDEAEDLTLPDLISQLEPTAKQLALEEGGLALMTIASSKGLTFDVTVTIGVEDETFSDEHPHLHEELRRLLYVAMTRAKSACYLTMATTRSGPVAFSHDGNPINSRSRSRFLSIAGIEPQGGQDYLGALRAFTKTAVDNSPPEVSQA